MSLLPCCQCGHGYHVEGHPAGQVYTCPRCRDDLDRSPARSPFEGLLVGATPTSAHRAWVDGVPPATPDLSAQLAAVTAERDRLVADLAAVQRAAWVLLSALTVAGPDHGFGVEVGRLALRLLVGEPPPTPEPTPKPAPGTVAWFDQARADLAAEGTPVDAADWLIGPDED